MTTEQLTEIDRLKLEVSNLKLDLLSKEQELEEAHKERAYWSNQHSAAHRRCADAIGSVIASATFIIEKGSAIRELLRKTTKELSRAADIVHSDICGAEVSVMNWRDLCAKATAALKEADQTEPEVRITPSNSKAHEHHPNR